MSTTLFKPAKATVRSRFTPYLIAVILLSSTTYSVFAQPSPPNQVNWINEIGANNYGSILTKTHRRLIWYHAVAISSNVLPVHTDG